MADEDYQYKDRQTPDLSKKFFSAGQGRISGYLAVTFGAMSLLAVLAFRYPTYLTTADLREVYTESAMRTLLMFGFFVAAFFSMLTFMRGRRKRLGAIGMVFTIMALSLGGWWVEMGEIKPVKVSLGLDWMLLDLFASGVVFIFIEKLLPKHKEQPILRPDWQLDLFYFCINHLAIGVLLIVSNSFAPKLFGWAVNAELQGWVTSLPIWGQFLLLLFCADFVQYWVHRTFHEVPALWKIHAVHHSTEYMDWLAGSRNHFAQILVDRTLVVVPLYLLGASTGALNAYVIFAALQAVFIHANVGIRFGFFKYILATPQFHHWHHSREKPAIDTNYAVHLPIYDMIFRTFHMPKAKWPAEYGTVSPLPRGYMGQLLYPFVRSKTRPEA